MTMNQDFRLIFEGFPAGVAFDDRAEDRVLIYLLDMAGCSVQAPSLMTAVKKMEELVPQFLEHLRARNVTIPEPSPMPPLIVASMQWQTSSPSIIGVVVEDAGPVDEELLTTRASADWLEESTVAA